MTKIPGIEAPEQSCSDSKCPWHGELPIRGRLIEGTVVSAHMQNTVVVEWEFMKKLDKYERFTRRTSRVSAHSPPCIPVKAGDKVLVAECRRLSKTKSFVVVSTRGG